MTRPLHLEARTDRAACGGESDGWEDATAIIDGDLNDGGGGEGGCCCCSDRDGSCEGSGPVVMTRS